MSYAHWVSGNMSGKMREWGGNFLALPQPIAKPGPVRSAFGLGSFL